MGKGKRLKAQRKQILGDHKKVGQRLVTPLNQIPGINPYSFQKDLAPEILWLGILEQEIGLQKTIQIANSIGGFLENFKFQQSFVKISDFYDFPNTKELLLHLEENSLLEFVESALADLVFLYPECPLSIFFQDPPSSLGNKNYLTDFEELFAELTDKRSKKSALMQANSVYLLHIQGKMHFGEFTPNFESLLEYPDTDESRKTASSIRATIGVLLDNPLSSRNTNLWGKYFWKRNLELVPIKL